MTWLTGFKESNTEALEVGLVKKTRGYWKARKRWQGEGASMESGIESRGETTWKQSTVELMGFGGSRNILSLSLFFLHMGALG